MKVAGLKVEWIGEALIVCALVWWFVFYSDVATLKKEPLTNFVNCIFSECIKPEGKFMLKAMGKTPYSPTVFWVGFAIGAAGLVLGKALSKDGAVAAATRQCPYCAESVKVEAKLCKHCGKELPEDTKLETTFPHLTRYQLSLEAERAKAAGDSERVRALDAEAARRDSA